MAGDNVSTKTDALGLGVGFLGLEGDALEDEHNKVIDDIETIRKVVAQRGNKVHSASLTALTGVGIDIDGAGGVPDAETNNALLIEFGGSKYVFGAQATIDLSAKTCGGDTIADFGVIYIFASLGAATATTDAETPAAAQGAGITSALLALASQAPPAPPEGDDVFIGHIMLDASSAFTIGTTNLDAATDTYVSYVGLPGVVTPAATLGSTAATATVDYGACDVRLGSGVVVAASGKDNVVLQADQGNIADGAFGAFVLLILADDSEYIFQIGEAYITSEDAQQAIDDYFHPYLAVAGSFIIQNDSGANFVPGTTNLDATGVTTTFTIAGVGGPASIDDTTDLTAAKVNA